MPPPNRPKNRPNRPKRNRPRRRPSGSGSGRRGGGSRRAAARREANRRAERNQDRARGGGGGGGGGADVRTGGESTGRERGILQSTKYIPKKKIKSLEQSVGSLDRRTQNAIDKGDAELVKELRKKKKQFVKKLGYARAHEAMISAAPLKLRDQVKKRIKANPNMLDSTGFDIFQETMDQDFIDPTRKIQNENPELFGDMYPFSSALQGGLPTVQVIKKAFGADDKQIPYNLEDMPGVRYPLDKTFGAYPADEKEPIKSEFLNRPTMTAPNVFATGPESNVATEEQKQAAIDRGIDPNFIFSLSDDPRTELIESDLNTGTALQLAEAANTKGELADILPKDASPEAQAELSEFLNRPTMTAPNVFALPESSKEALNEQADLNRKEYELQTYGKEITADDLAKADINPAFYNQKFSTPIIQQQLLKSGVLQNEQVQPALQEKTFVSPETKTFAPVLGLQDQNVLLPGSQVSGADYLTQVAENNEMAKNQIMNNDNLNIIQKEQLVNNLDNTTNFTPFTDPLLADSDPVFFDQYMSDALSKLR